MIDWQSAETHFLLNPRLPVSQRRRLEEVQDQLPHLSGHIWLLTSGTTSSDELKWVALSKSAFLASAQAVNEFLKIESTDRWLLALPQYHVGGLSIWARAHLSKNTVKTFDLPWNAQKFLDFCTQQESTLCSLVPTQLFDLIKTGQKCPPSLRGLLIGGAALQRDLFDRAVELGYPLHISYGMTETCSQIATSKENDRELIPLPHLTVRNTPGGLIQVKGSSLLTGFASVKSASVEYLDPKDADGWFTTQDLGFIEGGHLYVQGRESDQVKVLGENVFLPRVQTAFVNEFTDCAIVVEDDPRRGKSLSLVLPIVDLRQGLFDRVLSVHRDISPFEKVTRIYFVERIPKTDLGKVRTGELRSMLGLKQAPKQ